ncbi:MarR family winged helix-turn-helix transcriptional regulator [Ancylobacter sp. Lp-2]|nr:MarR family winged helix-turn-helix transcriptional regulator [Ancylobacter sp. Lp-2]MCB4767858.1 MarR family winged helix-turn-helix transcriptional regulator [Ancylobacter sp. Lp-2]
MSTPCHCVQLRKAARKIGARYDAVLAPVGINIAQFSLLRAVERRQPVSLTELGRTLDLDRSTMGRNVRVVEKLGLVRLDRGEDQREAVVSLSEHGVAVLRVAEPLWERCQRQVADQLGPTRLQLLGELGQLL